MTWRRCPPASYMIWPYAEPGIISMLDSCGNCCANCPLARIAAGHPEHAQADSLKLSALIGDAIDSDESGIEDALRPLYLDYLTKHKADLPALIEHEHPKEHSGGPLASGDLAEDPGPCVSATARPGPPPGTTSLRSPGPTHPGPLRSKPPTPPRTTPRGPPASAAPARHTRGHCVPSHPPRPATTPGDHQPPQPRPDTPGATAFQATRPAPHHPRGPPASGGLVGEARAMRFQMICLVNARRTLRKLGARQGPSWGLCSVRP